MIAPDPLWLMQPTIMVDAAHYSLRFKAFRPFFISIGTDIEALWRHFQPLIHSRADFHAINTQ